MNAESFEIIVDLLVNKLKEEQRQKDWYKWESEDLQKKLKVAEEHIALLEDKRGEE